MAAAPYQPTTKSPLAGAAETAGAGGLNIAETFPEAGAAGCGLRAVFCQGRCLGPTQACRDKSKAPRNDVWRTRVQAATGRLCLQRHE